MKKYELSFNTGSLVDYVNEQEAIITELVQAPVTIASGIDVLVGHKGDFKLNSLSNEVYLTAASCGWTVSGTTTFGQNEVIVDAIQLKEALCVKDLNAKYLQNQVLSGSNPDMLNGAFEQLIVAGKLAKVALEMDKMYWTADKSTGTGNMALAEGMASFLKTEGGSVFASGATSATAASKSNIIAKVDAIVSALPVEILSAQDLAIYMSDALYTFYIQALLAAQNPIDNDSQKRPYGRATMVPGFNIEVIATPGLNGTQYIYASSKKNFVFATDLVEDANDIKMWYSEDNDEMRIRLGFKFGVGAHFTQMVVHNNASI
jgi:hypothetical protein